MSNGDNKSECLRYPGQPDTHTRDELIEYFEELAAKAEPGPTPETGLKTKVTNSGLTLYSYGGGLWFSTKAAAQMAWPKLWANRASVSSR